MLQPTPQEMQWIATVENQFNLHFGGQWRLKVEDRIDVRGKQMLQVSLWQDDAHRETYVVNPDDNDTFDRYERKVRLRRENTTAIDPDLEELGLDTDAFLGLMDHYG